MDSARCSAYACHRASGLPSTPVTGMRSGWGERGAGRRHRWGRVKSGFLFPILREDPIMDNMAIIVRDDAYDKVLTPLAFAYLAAASNIEVNMLFVGWAVR